MKGRFAGGERIRELGLGITSALRRFKLRLNIVLLNHEEEKAECGFAQAKKPSDSNAYTGSTSRYGRWSDGRF